MSFENASKLIVILAGITLLSIWLLYTIIVPRRKKRALDRIVREKFNAEKARIDALPKLRTYWLLQVPKEMMSKEPVLRSYGTRYDRLLIVDETGTGWVGLAN